MSAQLTVALAAAATTVLLSGALAPAAYADHTRQHTCEQAGGTFTAGSTAAQDRCVVVVRESVTAPSGEPIVTFSSPRPSGPAIIADGRVTPTGTPTVDRQVEDVGDPVEVVTIVPGAPVTTTPTTVTTRAPNPP